MQQERVDQTIAEKRAIAIQIASTIKQQLYAGGMQIVWSWGAHEFVALEKGLQFRVNGHHFTGYVRIIYDEGSDLYNVFLGNVQKGKWRETKNFTGVYCDQLTYLIDRKIEYIPEYH